MPAPGRAAAEAFVITHLAHLVDRRAAANQPLSSTRFRGGQRAADEALARFRVDGYHHGMDVAYPQRDRAGSALSPWIRNGLLPLGRLWDHVADGPAADVAAFRWSLFRLERARLRYAAGAASPTALRPAGPVEPARSPESGAPGLAAGWDRQMACVDVALDELADDGWLPAPPRRWLAQLCEGGSDGDLFRHLLDGARAVTPPAWTAARAGIPVSRWQVERHAPGLCASCDLVTACPVDHELPTLVASSGGRSGPAGPPDTTAPPGPSPDAPGSAFDDGPLPPLAADALGPDTPTARAGSAPEAVWLTAESMGDADPGLVAHPDLPALFVFDEPLLARLRLAPRRLVFLVEHLSDLAARRPVEVWLGSPVRVLADRAVAVTFTPVPGWHRRQARISPVVVHPWPWLGRHLGAPGTARRTANAIDVMKTGGSQFPHRRPIDEREPSATESSTGRNIGALV
ncbi:MAG: deoxyribodipyrimidine photolyase [Acidimicrobiia bacterium]|nr:deoxyribodipyrimidine photolyase [Acidimicrobiia bacterium]MDH5289092.1 deoxyribodipyrimidine photolyase [Acidimicrobiia bacterium]